MRRSLGIQTVSKAQREKLAEAMQLAIAAPLDLPTWWMPDTATPEVARVPLVVALTKLVRTAFNYEFTGLHIRKSSQVSALSHGSRPCV